MKHALIVEDDFRLSDALEDRLIAIGFNSFEKTWTEEGAVEVAFRRRPDLVLVADRIEEGSPISAARRIALAYDVPVLLVTSKASGPIHWRAEGARVEGSYALADLGRAVAEAMESRDGVELA